MRALLVVTLAAGALCAAAATQAAAATASELRDSATLCLVGGVSEPAICNSQNASRLSRKPDICHCDGPQRTVKAPWCAPGEEPPAENIAFVTARGEAAKDGDLFGDTFEGRRMCVKVSGD